MDLVFESGSRSEPRGHALIYFRTRSNPDRVVATYVIVAPIAIDLAKYMPPLFAGQFPLGGLENLNSFPIPPLPEPVADLGRLRALAEVRHDDLIFAGTADDSPPDRLLLVSAEASSLYADLYRAYAETVKAKPLNEPSTDVQELFYQLMTEQELVSEVAKLTGKLRYAVEGHDGRQIQEAVQEMERIAGHLPEKYRLGEVIAAGRVPGDRGRQLSELLLERVYRILREEYVGLDELERRIQRVMGDE